MRSSLDGSGFIPYSHPRCKSGNREQRTRETDLPHKGSFRIERDIARLTELGLIASSDMPRVAAADAPLAVRLGRMEELPASKAKYAVMAAAALCVVGVAAWMMMKPHAEPSVVSQAVARNALAVAADPQYFVQATQVRVGEDAPLNGPIALPAPRPMVLPAAPADTKPAAAKPAPAEPSAPAHAAAAAPQRSTTSNSAASAPTVAQPTPAGIAAANAGSTPPPATGNAARSVSTDAQARPAAPPTLVASAAPTTAPETAKPQPARAAGALAPLTKVAPEFPREAISTGVDKGRVKVRLAIDKDGNVSQVEIVDSKPRRIFDRSVQRALTQWKFPPGDDKRFAETEVVFDASR